MNANDRIMPVLRKSISVTSLEMDQKPWSIISVIN